jgi:tungstate transport system substrate-binding protein
VSLSGDGFAIIEISDNTKRKVFSPMAHRFLLTVFTVMTAILTVVGFNRPVAANEKFITLQSTTSTENSGLLSYLLPQFTKKTGVEVRTVAVGTGQALKNARNGDGDVLLVHAREAEEDFVAAGYGVERFDLMYNDFILLGPANDPAKVKEAEDVSDALKRIAESKSTFVSRGDDSGTHKKEMKLWAGAAIDPTGASGTWYREAGSGMGATINTAVGLNGYVLTDRATWISFNNKSGHTIVFEDSPPMFNQYGIIQVNPERHPHVKAKQAKALVDWMLSPEGQGAIAAYRVDGQQLFFPNAKKVD